MDEAQILALVAAHAAQVDAIEAEAAGRVTATLGAVTDWTDHDEITRAATAAGQVVRAGSQTAAAATDAYLTRALAAMVGGAPRMAGVIDVTAPLRLGVRGYDSVYGRVADTVRFGRSRGLDVDDAVRAGLERADAMVRTDVSLARRRQAQRWFEGRPDDVVGYRRVIHPEMSKTGVCGLCIAAADRRYRRSDLLPLHARCKCTVLPITRALDPGGTLNDADLAAVYATSESNRARDLKRVRYVVRDHGELGPVLTDADHHWRGPSEVAAA